MDLAERPESGFRRHPWELSRWKFFVRRLARAGVLGAPRRVLDIGSGDGWFVTELLHELPPGSTAVGWDLGYDHEAVAALGLSEDAKLRLTRDAPEGRFDLLLLLDVLEHVEDDAEFLIRRVREQLEPSGTVLISVPAWQALFTSHDLALGHHRRYRPSQLKRLIARSGLTISEAGGLFHSLLVPRALSRIRERLRPPEPAPPKPLRWTGGPLLTRAVDLALTLDNGVSHLSANRLDVPGLSYWALCRVSPPARGRA